MSIVMTSSISGGEKAITSSDLSGKEVIMRLNEQEINNYLQPFFGQHEDGFQQAWLEILERDPQTLEEIAPIVRKIRNRAIKQYLIRKYKEDSLYKPIGKNGDESFTLESILASPAGDVAEEYSGRDGFYKKIVDFLIGEYLSQKNENLALKIKEIDLKTERLRLRSSGPCSQRILAGSGTATTPTIWTPFAIGLWQAGFKEARQTCLKTFGRTWKSG